MPVISVPDVKVMFLLQRNPLFYCGLWEASDIQKNVAAVAVVADVAVIAVRLNCF